MDRVINVFIGGSSEGLQYASKLKEKLEVTAQVKCVVWNRDVFEYNESFLDSLTKASIIYDFGIFMATADDEALIRDKIDVVPRDNVLLEYGMFLGSLGNNKTFLVQEHGCKLPTDLQGYSTPRFKRTDKSKTWDKLAESILKNIITQFQKSEIQLLPSTSLAIGYFNSFVSKLARNILENEGCQLNKKGKLHKDVIFKIIIPQNLSEDIGSKAQVYFRKNNLIQDEIGNVGRPFPVRYYLKEGREKLTIVDIPTTLNAIRPSVNLLIPDKGLGTNPDKIKTENKEIENFKKTLDYLISQDDFAKGIVITQLEDF